MSVCECGHLTVSVSFCRAYLRYMFKSDGHVSLLSMQVWTSVKTKTNLRSHGDQALCELKSRYKVMLQDFDTRVVVVSSAGHATLDHWKGVDFADMHYKEGRTYGKLNAYGQSKSANILFAKQIAVR